MFLALGFAVLSYGLPEEKLSELKKENHSHGFRQDFSCPQHATVCQFCHDNQEACKVLQIINSTHKHFLNSIQFFKNQFINVCIVHTHTHTHTHTYIYIYIYKERGRRRGKIYIYIYNNLNHKLR